MKKILLILLCLPMIGFGQNPNYSEDKYVVTGWIHNNDINLFNQIE